MFTADSGAISPRAVANRIAPKLPSDLRTTIRRRFLILVFLTLIPFVEIHRGIAVLISGGSPLAYLSVIPLLTVMIACGYRVPPRGVADPESDWILAALFGVLGFFLRHLMSNRFPTLSGLWYLPLVGAVLWAACIASVLFGVRRVMQMWALWVFALATATPLPYLLATAALGGGVIAIGAVTGAIGAIAVFLGSRSAPWSWRVGVAVSCWLSSPAVAAVAAGAGLERLEHADLLIVVVSGALIPVCGYLVLRGVGGPRPNQTDPKAVPRRSPLGIAVLALGAVLVFGLNRPFAVPDAAPVNAGADWASRVNWPVRQEFGFIARYLGPRATFVRHPVPSEPGQPEAAVDIITADSLATLRTYRDAIWYPATAPPNYRDYRLAPEHPIVARVAATDSSLATSADAVDWYVLTWTWQTGDAYQQIFVVINQTWTSRAAPPAPAPLSLRANVIGPALWLARQQADPAVNVGPAVAARARQVAERVLAAGGLAG